MGYIHVVVGAQAGSEAKGHVTWQIASQILERSRGSILNIRTGGPNAGHTVYDAQGRKYPFRQIPVGVVASDAERVMVAIAPGSEVDPEVLAEELGWLEDNDIDFSMVISSEATLLTKNYSHAEQSGDLISATGSTGKGIGAARAARAWRTARLVRDDPELVEALDNRGVWVAGPDEWDNLIQFTLAAGGHLILEGTQGFVLGTHQGYYPQVTTSDCTAIDFMAAARVNPWSPYVHAMGIYAVAREYPIRVAGNSGPLPGETTWAALGLPEEHTTVTKKVRRVSEWNADWVARAVRANGGPPSVAVVLTMVDQKFPDLANFSGYEDDLLAKIGGPEAGHPLWDHLAQVEEDAGAPVLFFTTGPTSAVYFRGPIIISSPNGGPDTGVGG